MRRGILVFTLLVLALGAALSLAAGFGLPMRALPPSKRCMIGAIGDMATDRTRPDLFSGAAARLVPFQILYPSSAPGKYAPYMTDAGPQVAAIVAGHGWMSGVLLGQLGSLAAPWTDAALPSEGGPFPVILYLPGVTGYMQMGSFLTTDLVARGYIVITLNQPGAVAAAVLADHRIIPGMTRTQATALIAPSYRASQAALPAGFAQALAPEVSIVPYLAEDVGLVLDRLAQINADPAHPLHGKLDLGRVGLMGMSLGAIVTAQACAMEDRIDACLMMDAPVPTEVASHGLRQAALWISRPAEDQRLERAASGGWPEDEIAAQALTINQALANSPKSQLVLVPGLFHLDFTDLPALQPALGWLGQSGAAGVVHAHGQINAISAAFFARTIGPAAP